MFSLRTFLVTASLIVASALTFLYIVGTPGVITSGAYMTMMVILHETIRATLDENYAGHVRATYLRVGGFLLLALVVDVYLGYLQPAGSGELNDLLTRAQALVGTIATASLGWFFIKLAWKELRNWRAKRWGK